MARRKKIKTETTVTPGGPVDNPLSTSVHANQRNRLGLPMRLLIVIVVALGFYWRTTEYGFVYLDDDQLIVQQQDQLTTPAAWLRAFQKPYFRNGTRDHAYYRPLVSASYAWDAICSGKDASGYHRTNVLMHAMASVLVFLWLRTRGFRDNVSLIGGIAFALHPVLVEAVAWIPGRPDLVMTVCVLAAWIFHTKSQTSTHWLMRVLHPGFWLLSLLSKEAALAMPMIWLFEGHWLHGRPWRRIAEPWRVASWALVAAVYFFMRTQALSGSLGMGGVNWRSMIANTSVLVSSLGKCVLPLQLAVMAIPEDTWLWPGAAVLTGLALIAKRYAVTRRDVVWGLFAYLAVMLPSLPATHLLVLECRLYLPVAILLGLVLGVVEKLGGNGRTVPAAALTMLALFALRSHIYLGAFRDRRAFAEASIQGSPHSALAHKNLGVTLHLLGNRDEARKEYQSALMLDQDEPVAHNNLGVILMAEGKLVDAERELRRELATNPGYGEAHHNLAMVLRATQRSEEAVGHWQASLSRNADDVVAMRALYDFYSTRGFADAERYRQLLERQRESNQP